MSTTGPRETFTSSASSFIRPSIPASNRQARDDLAEIVKGNLQIRQEAVREAEQMIATQAGSFLRWLEGRSVVPTITALHGHHERLRAAELERVRKLLAAGTSPEQALDLLARGLTNKFLHAPTQALNHAGEVERAELLLLIHRVYQLSDGSEGD